MIVKGFTPENGVKVFAIRGNSVTVPARTGTTAHRPGDQHAQHAAESRKPGESPAMSQAPDHGELLNHSTDPGHVACARYFGTLTQPEMRTRHARPVGRQEDLRDSVEKIDGPVGS